MRSNAAPRNQQKAKTKTSPFRVFEKKFDATRRRRPETPHPHPHPRTRADLEASLHIDAQHESWIDTHRRHWVRRCKDLAGLDENLEDDPRIRSTGVRRLDIALRSYSVLALGLFGGIRTDALRRIAEGGWDAEGCREWNRRIRLIMEDDEEPEEPEPTLDVPVPLSARDAALARESLQSLRRRPSRGAFDARDEVVAAAQRTATGLERDYLDDGDDGVHGDLRDTPDDDDDSYDDDDDDETETTAAVAGTNLTREILHESPHYRQLVEHYRRRMGEPGYDPDASDDEDDPIRDSLVAATVAETVGSHEAARRRGGSSSHTSGARRFVAVVGHDGAHGLVTATRASRGAEANVAARAAVAAREVYAAAGHPYPYSLGFREAHRFAGVPYPDEFPTNVDSVRSEDDRGVGRLLAGRLVERERLARVVGEDDDEDDATVAPSPPSLPAPIDEAGLGEMDERDLRAALMDTARRLEAAQDELLCQICFTERRDALIMPCLHLLYCRRCVDRSSEANERRGLPDRCPCCRASVGGVLRCKRL